MKRRILAMALATALALSLTACGGGNSNSSASNPGGSSSSNSSQTDGSDASKPDGNGDASFTPEPLPNVTLTLNKTEVTLNKAGATFQLRYSAEPEVNNLPAYGSDNAQVATISADGTITAVAPGKATITVELGGASAACTVTCDWKEETKPTEPSKPDSSKPDSSKPAEPDPAPAANVDLADFYTTTTGKYDFAFMMEADADMLASFFAGLSNISTAQQLVYLCGMSPSPNGDFALVQVNDSKDVDAVKAIFQARIDYMVGDGNGPGGAFYPMEMTMWEENARIVSNGNYVMLIAHDNCDDIVNAFNALF